jgi:hypothetical protein
LSLMICINTARRKTGCVFYLWHRLQIGASGIKSASYL